MKHLLFWGFAFTTFHVSYSKIPGTSICFLLFYIVCLLLIHAIGECNGNAVKFFYDPIHQKCITFLWSGCIGNGNRFDSYRILSNDTSKTGHI
uniref:BPTI/Kunitz inhibitor domain-containing protein n=1 Tax=Monopterus albus TaxID=43700 RepID=A0A3Q3JEQ6_MONAL